MSAETTLKTLKNLFPESDPAWNHIGWLNSQSADITFGLFMFKVAISATEIFNQQLPVMAQALLNETGGQVATATATGLIRNVLQSAAEKSGFKGSKVMPPAKGTIDKLIESAPVKGEESVLAPKKPALQKDPILKKPSDFMKAEPTVKEKKIAKGASPYSTEGLVNAVIELKDAKCIGQQVAGTGGMSSIYRVFALGDVNLAVKFGSSACAIRADGTFTNEIKEKLGAAGFKDHNSYMSLHIKTYAVPMFRVIGAILFSTGLNFTQVATSKEVLSV